MMRMRMRKRWTDVNDCEDCMRIKMNWCTKSWCSTNCFISQCNTQYRTFCTALHCTMQWKQCMLNGTLHKDCTARNSEMQVLHLESRLFTALHFTNLNELSYIWKLFSHCFHAVLSIVLAQHDNKKLISWKLGLFSGHILEPCMPLWHVLHLGLRCIASRAQMYCL